MNNQFYAELKNAYAQIGSAPTPEQTEVLSQAYNQVLKFALINRTGGLAKIAENAEALASEGVEAYFKNLLLLLADSVNATAVEEYGMIAYCASRTSGADAVAYLMCLKGALLIQEGLNPKEISSLLKAFL